MGGNSTCSGAHLKFFLTKNRCAHICYHPERCSKDNIVEERGLCAHWVSIFKKRF